jgi:hypothetical protein
MTQVPTDPNERFIAALSSDAIQSIYVNGFVVGQGNGDITVVLERHGRPLAAVSMSFTIAKTMAIAIGQTIANLEAKSGRQMLTADEIEKLREIRTET